MTRLVDPIHFFDSQGVSVLSRKHLEDEIAKLRQDNEQLRRRLKVAVRKLREKATSPDSETAN